MLFLIFVTFSWESVDASSTVFLRLKPCMSFPCSVKYYIIKHFLLSLTFKFYPEWLGFHHMLCSLSVGGRNNPAFCAGGYSPLRLLHPVQLAPEIKLCLLPISFPHWGPKSHWKVCFMYLWCDHSWLSLAMDSQGSLLYGLLKEWGTSIPFLSKSPFPLLCTSDSCYIVNGLQPLVHPWCQFSSFQWT